MYNTGSILWSIFTIISAILEIILFFKLWKMTNDVSDIKKMIFLKFNSNKHNNITTKETTSKVTNYNNDWFTIGDLVVDENDNQLVITKIIDDYTVECRKPGMWINLKYSTSVLRHFEGK